MRCAFSLFDKITFDFPVNFSLGFQDPASPWMLAIIDLHDRIIFYLIIRAALKRNTAVRVEFLLWWSQP
jgi:hypothetical protein